MATFDFEGFILKYTESVLGDNGLTLVPRETMLANMEDNYKEIYGVDINLNAGSPDKTFIENQVQLLVDIQEYVNYLFASMDVSKARGSILDMLCRLNNVFRKGATYTIQLVNVFVNADITLNGASTSTPFIVQDEVGNQYVLLTTTPLLANTTTALEFQAVLSGTIQSAVNTITIQVTLTTGVVSVNNPNPPLVVGVNEESDVALRFRRDVSTSLAGSGGYSTLQGSLLQIPSVASLYLDNNPTGITNANGTLPHSIHLIITGGTDKEIATVLFEKLNSNGCCGQMGANTYPIETLGASPFLAKWDVPIQQSLFIRFSIQPLASGASFNIPSIITTIAALLTPGVNESVSSARVVNIAQIAITSGGGTGTPVSVELSKDGTTWRQTVMPNGIQYQFAVLANNINVTVLSYPPIVL